MCAYHRGVLTVFLFMASVQTERERPLAWFPATFSHQRRFALGQCADCALACLRLTVLTGTAGSGSSSHRLACSASYGHRKGQREPHIVTRAT